MSTHMAGYQHTAVFDTRLMAHETSGLPCTHGLRDSLSAL